MTRRVLTIAAVALAFVCLIILTNGCGPEQEVTVNQGAIEVRADRAGYTDDDLTDARAALAERPCEDHGDWKCGILLASGKGDLDCNGHWNHDWIGIVARNDGTVLALGDSYESLGPDAMVLLFRPGNRIEWDDKTGGDCLVTATEEIRVLP